MNNLKEKVMENKFLLSLLNQMNPTEKENTLSVINDLLEDMQGKSEGLAKAIQEASKKQPTK